MEMTIITKIELIDMERGRHTSLHRVLYIPQKKKKEKRRDELLIVNFDVGKYILL